MSVRSPKSCVTSLTYGVSPQPAHAPEYSKSGSKNCDALHVERDARARRPRAARGRTRSSSRSGVAQRRLRRMLERLVPRVRLVLGGADLDAQAAAGAVLGRDLHRVRVALEVVALVGDRLEGRRACPASSRLVVDLDADRGVRADHRALVALDADRLVPDRDLEGDVALLPAGRAGRPGAVGREGADTGSRSPWFASITAVTRCTKSGAFAATRWARASWSAVTRLGIAHLVQVRERRVDHGEVLLHDLRAPWRRRSSRWSA